jgi:hypothetical protein
MNVPDNILEPVNKKGFFSHVFSSTEEGKAEILNVVQYSLMGVIPIVMLNKMIQRFIPDADPDKSSIELLAEVLIQIVVMFVGIVIIHRIITYIPTYSEFKYESLTLTNVILAFLILVLSIQTKLGIKVNVLFDRVSELWNGPSVPNVKPNARNPGTRHVPSQGDHLGSSQTDMFPPAPLSMSKPDGGYDYMVKGNAPTVAPMMEMGPMAANGVLGGSFGSSF